MTRANGFEADGTMQTLWHISGGPVGRAYAGVFVRHGVALLGPGDAGRWSPERDDADFDGPAVRRFASEPEDLFSRLARPQSSEPWSPGTRS